MQMQWNTWREEIFYHCNFILKFIFAIKWNIHENWGQKPPWQNQYRRKNYRQLVNFWWWWCWFSSKWLVISTGELIFLMKTNMAFSSRFFKVNEKLNLQRKRCIKSRQVNLILSRFFRLLQDKNAQSKMKQLPERKKSSPNRTDYPRQM